MPLQGNDLVGKGSPQLHKAVEREHMLRAQVGQFSYQVSLDIEDLVGNEAGFYLLNGHVALL